jgi:hypothetical protein
MCPKCGSDKIQAVQPTNTKGFGAGKGLLGFCCFGPIGLLFGLCGMGKNKKSKAYRMCLNCGKKF